MYLVESLLTALVKEGGESLVLHVGERPAVVTPRGTVEIASSTIALESVDALLDDILTPAAYQTLLEFGVVEAEIPPSPLTPLDRFSAVVARGGDDVWIEIRRRRIEPASQAGQVRPSTTEPPRVQHARPARGRLASGGSPSRLLRATGLERLLSAALARRAETLYLSPGGRPAVRVGGEIARLEDEPELSAADVEALTAEARPDESKVGFFTAAEWTCEVAGAGHIRCATFVDRRGPGAVFHVVRSKAPSAEELGLSPEIRALASAEDGLVLIAGPRSSGTPALLAAFVELIARTRGGHVVTLESQPSIAHAAGKALVSQREVCGALELVPALRAALRERPDVVVIEELLAPEAIGDAVEAAAQGQLVIAGLPASSTSDAVSLLLDLVPSERRPALRTLLARTLRGVVAQVSLRKAGGGRVAAREVLLGTPAVSALIADGAVDRLPAALGTGRRHGMVPLNDALLAFVQSGAVDVREAWRRSHDRAGLLTLLKREGIDTSFVSRLTS